MSLASLFHTELLMRRADKSNGQASVPRVRALGFLETFVKIWVGAFLRAYLPASLPAYLPAYLPANLPGWLAGWLAGGWLAGWLGRAGRPSFPSFLRGSAKVVVICSK